MITATSERPCCTALNPDVMLIDIMMPGMNGLELYAGLFQDSTLARIPVVFMTGVGGHGQSGDRALSENSID